MSTTTLRLLNPLSQSTTCSCDSRKHGNASFEHFIVITTMKCRSLWSERMDGWTFWSVDWNNDIDMIFNWIRNLVKLFNLRQPFTFYEYIPFFFPSVGYMPKVTASSQEKLSKVELAFDWEYMYAFVVIFLFVISPQCTFHSF